MKSGPAAPPSRGRDDLKFVLDATPLIYLSKVGLARLLAGLSDPKFTTPLVRREVIEAAVQRRLPEGDILQRLILDRVIIVARPRERGLLRRLGRTRGLAPADAEVLTLAHDLQATAVIDDLVGRRVAQVYGIRTLGTGGLLMLGVLRGVLKKREALDALDRMLVAGWRCTPELYATLRRELES